MKRIRTSKIIASLDQSGVIRSGQCTLRVRPGPGANHERTVLLFETLDTGESLEAWIVGDIQPSLAENEWLTGSKPVELQVEFKRYFGNPHAGQPNTKTWDLASTRGTVKLMTLNGKRSFQLDLDVYVLMVAMCTGLFFADEVEFWACAMLARLAPASFHRCGRDLITRLGFIDVSERLDQEVDRLKAGPRQPFDSAEFLTRLSDPNAYVWYSELRQFLGNMKHQHLKSHLIKSGLAHGATSMHNWSCTVESLLAVFVPYVRGFKGKRDALRNFEWALETAGRVSPPRIDQPDHSDRTS